MRQIPPNGSQYLQGRLLAPPLAIRTAIRGYGKRAVKSLSRTDPEPRILNFADSSPQGPLPPEENWSLPLFRLGQGG